MISSTTLSDRRGIWAFVLGVVMVTGGVLMHARMFLMGRHNHFVLVGMPIGWDMVLGMAAIVVGCGIAAYGLLPRDIGTQLAASQDIVVTPPEDAPLSWPHWGLMGVLVIALVIDIMKPATLGFTLPGMMSEYQVTKATVSSFPFSALVGTVIGSIIWGVLADIYGRKATILLSAVMFVGTSICGAMPSLAWNVGMCFMMSITSAITRTPISPQ
jgi:putative MFS transporter